MHNPTTKPDTCPVATPGCACLPPGRRIHHLNILERMVMAQIFLWCHHGTYAPAQAGAALISCWTGVIQRSL